MAKVFFDSSVLFSAMYSKRGASYALVCFIKRKEITGIITETVIEEVISNIHKLPSYTDGSVRQFIGNGGFLVRRSISVLEIQPYISIVEDKDVHVIAGALLTHCEYLVTLDKKHIATASVKDFLKGRLFVVSPQEMLSRIVSENQVFTLPPALL